ncbi:hypothetical protein HRI_000213400 [Hibiscus trionum]|uniref:Uncharacterized protein n=1 Tax=Hibiscus trionum TaxID=183268 RepID=A0A9W7GWP7_HIBTR|nr:hypothetical protein HRI_000213400 [Hibiscus trionum]
MKQNCLYLTILVLVISNSMHSSKSISTVINSTVSVVADELEFLMDSHVSRILQTGGYWTSSYSTASQPVVSCGRYQPYSSCLPSSNRPVTTQNCGTYTRGC